MTVEAVCDEDDDEDENDDGWSSLFSTLVRWSIVSEVEILEAFGDDLGVVANFFGG